MAGTGRRERRLLGELVRELSPEVLREIVTSASDHHNDVERHVRLAAAREEGDLMELRVEVDRALRTHRFLGYRESSEWARSARPIVEELRSAEPEDKLDATAKASVCWPSGRALGRRPQRTPPPLKRGRSLGSQGGSDGRARYLAV